MADSVRPAISADGRFVAFNSDATNLVPGDTNGADDVFVRDRQTGTTQRVSVGPGGVQGNGDSVRARRSRRTGGSSPSSRTATNLVPGDTNGADGRVRPDLGALIYPARQDADAIIARYRGGVRSACVCDAVWRRAAPPWLRRTASCSAAWRAADLTVPTSVPTLGAKTPPIRS